MNNKIIEIAKTYIGTPWMHQGRMKKIGVDCAGLVVCVLKEFGYNVNFDVKGYNRIPEGVNLKNIAREFFDEVKFDEIKDGDILLFNILGNPQHIAFYLKENDIDYIIHSYGDPSINKVVQSRLDSKWRERICGIFRIK